MVGRAESIRIFRGMNLFDHVWVRAFFSGVFLSCLKTGNYRPPSPYPREAKVKFAWVLQVEYGVVGPVPGLQVERFIRRKIRTYLTWSSRPTINPKEKNSVIRPARLV
uniref:Uncharacterized protein n=1 Tax=Cacopsylla melanoneura TaxID=428564 RepID=A0A8D8VP56_9HEMI